MVFYTYKSNIIVKLIISIPITKEIVQSQVVIISSFIQKLAKTLKKKRLFILKFN